MVRGVKLCRTIEACNDPYPRCIAAEGDEPSVDCGGAEGYTCAMRVLENSNYPEYQEVFEWMQHRWITAPDVKKSLRIRNAHRKIVPMWRAIKKSPWVSPLLEIRGLLARFGQMVYCWLAFAQSMVGFD